jgi:hypothetical protein
MPSEERHRCPKCGGGILCRNCEAHQTDCHRLELQCGIEVSLYTIGGIDFGAGYCADFACRCGHEEKVRGA